MYQKPRLIRDGTGRHKLTVSLPGGRYQLSLDDRAVNVLIDGLNIETRETVPDSFVPFFVAMGDAWFPRERDIDSVIEDLPVRGSLTTSEREILVDYVTGAAIPARHKDRVERVFGRSEIADVIDFDDIDFNSLPEIPEWSSLSDREETTKTKRPDEEESTGAVQDQERDQSETSTENPSQSEIVERLTEIAGIGPERAESFVEAGIKSLSEIADARPTELSTISGISEGIATVAIEGARETLGHKKPTTERLATETGTEKQVFESALSPLAASGIPATEAEDTLRVLHGPTVADVDGVSGHQAYFLWEEGYRTPYDLVEASTDELTNVYQVGETTAAEIQNAARDLINTT